MAAHTDKSSSSACHRGNAMAVDRALGRALLIAVLTSLIVPLAHSKSCTDIVLVADTIDPLKGRPRDSRTFADVNAANSAQSQTIEGKADSAANCYRLQLERVPLAEFVRFFFGELLDLNYVVQAPLIGEVSVRSDKGLTRPQLEAVAERLLDSNGYRLETITPDLLAVTKHPMPRLAQVLQQTTQNLGERLHVVPLRFINAGIAREALGPFVTDTTLPATDDAYDFVFIYASETRFAYLMGLLEYIDVDDMFSINFAIVRMEHADATLVQETLQTIFGASESSQDAALVQPIHISVDTSDNALSIIAHSNGLVTKALRWIDRLDTPADSANRRVLVYRPVHREASAILDLIEAIFSETAFNSELERTLDRTSLIADDDSDSILMFADESDAERLRRVFSVLDKPTTRIEVRAQIIEVILNDNVDFGASWGSTNDLGKGYDGALSLFTDGETLARSGGFNYTILDGDGDERALFSALSSLGTLNIVSSPFVATLSGGSAFIRAGEQRPVPVARIEGSRRRAGPLDPNSPGFVQIPGTDPDDLNDPTLVQLQVEYRDIGISLRITATASANNIVRLTVKQETTDIGPLLQVTPEIQANSFLERAITTELAIPAGATVAIAALQRENVSDANAGIPFIRSVPLLGQLFRRRTNAKTRTELLVLLTPEILPISQPIGFTKDEYATELSKVLKTL